MVALNKITQFHIQQCRCGKGGFIQFLHAKGKKNRQKISTATKGKKSRNTVIILIWSLPSADFICLCCFYLLRLIILETNLSACLQMAELRIILICTHTHSAFVHCFFFFLFPLWYIFNSYFNNCSSNAGFKTPTHGMHAYSCHMFALIEGWAGFLYRSNYRCWTQRILKTCRQNHRCERSVCFLN